MEAGAKLEEPSATHSDEAHAVDDVVCLHSAAYHGDAAAAARYVAEARGDADLAQASKDAWHGGTPMCYAAMRGHAGVVDVLVEAGASQCAAMDGFTPLMLAAQRGHVDVCKKLLAAGADVNAVDANDGGTAAVWAAAEGHVDVLKVLHEHGADLGACDAQGDSVLANAALNGQESVVRFLLAQEVDATRANNAGKTARELAEGAGHAQVAALLGAERSDSAADAPS